ncbi:putative isoflavone reductase like protein P3 [Stipitochalara longipes BDJ]|nr:putative isoflavone reductase like protein P3 [Stipitochalara longipes BDJ]
MSSLIKKVAVAGPNGNTGPAIVKALLASGFEVTALTRSIDKTRQTLGPDIKALKVDYLSHGSLVSALKGIDAVVVCGAGMLPEQTNIIDAAIAAGVSRFLPSSLDGDISTPARRALPFNERKVVVSEYLKARESVISHTSIRTGPLLDFCISRGALINMKEHSMTRFDDGEKKFSTTMTETAGKAVAAALKMGKEAENREFWIYDLVTSQNELLNWGKEVLPDVEWNVTEASTEELKRKAEEAMKVDRKSRMVDIMMKVLAIHGRDFDSVFKKVDNEVLGIGFMGESEAKEILGRLVGPAKSWQAEREVKDAAVISQVTTS